jgi:hypothetical protein
VQRSPAQRPGGECGASAARIAADYRDEVLTSLIALKAMTLETTGAIVAAPTTSLPGDIGGVRNWDYRYCWLRDSVLALDALLATGYSTSTARFSDWRSLASRRSEGSTRGAGRAGERSSSTSRRSGVSPMTASGKRADRDAASCTRKSWRGSCSTGRYESPSSTGWTHHWSAGNRFATRFTRRSASGGTTLSVALSPSTTDRRSSTRACSTIPLVGFLPGIDEHVSGTIDAIARELGRDGFVSRYSTAETDDGLSGDEGQFLAFSFWLVSALAQAARVEEARALRAPPRLDERPRLAEEYDVKRGRQIGNFPQAFSHLTLIGAATAIAAAEGEAKAVAA